MGKPQGQSGNREHFRIPTFVYHFCKTVLLLNCHRMELGIAKPLENVPFGARTQPSSKKNDSRRSQKLNDLQGA